MTWEPESEKDSWEHGLCAQRPGDAGDVGVMESGTQVPQQVYYRAASRLPRQRSLWHVAPWPSSVCMGFLLPFLFIHHLPTQQTWN